MERFGCDISFMIVQLQFQPKKKFYDRQMKFLGEMIIVALLVKVLICRHILLTIAVNTKKMIKYWVKNAENISNCQGKNNKY